MSGFNLGFAAMSFTIRAGGTHTSATFWVSETSMPAYPAAGSINVSSTVCISVLGFTTTRKLLLSYDLQTMSERVRTNVPHTGSYSISIMGVNFGENAYSQQERVGGSSAETSRWVSDTSISCAKASGSLNLVGINSVTVQEMRASVSESISFDVPEINTFLYANLPGHLILKRFTVFGNSLSIDHACAKMSIGLSSCQETKWLS